MNEWPTIPELEGSTDGRNGVPQLELVPQLRRELPYRLHRDAVFILDYLVATSYMRRSTVLTHASSRKLVEALELTGRGLGKNVVQAHLRALEESGLIARERDGEYAIHPAVVRSSVESAPRADQTGPVSGPVSAAGSTTLRRSLAQSGPDLGRPGPNSGPGREHMSSSTDVENDKHHHEDPSGGELAECVADEAHALGVRGTVLGLVRREPARTLAWLRHLQARQSAGHRVNVGAYVNRMLRDPSCPWPPGVTAEASILASVDGRVVLLDRAGHPWTPLVPVVSAGLTGDGPPRSPTVATAAAIEAALVDGPDGQRWDEDAQFLADVNGYLVAVRADGVRTDYTVTAAKLRALQDRGVLAGRDLPPHFYAQAARF